MKACLENAKSMARLLLDKELVIRNIASFDRQGLNKGQSKGRKWNFLVLTGMDETAVCCMYYASKSRGNDLKVDSELLGLLPWIPQARWLCLKLWKQSDLQDSDTSGGLEDRALNHRGLLEILNI